MFTDQKKQADYRSQVGMPQDEKQQYIQENCLQSDRFCNIREFFVKKHKEVEK